MANDARRAAAACSPDLNAEQLEAMLAELDAICRQARELTATIKVEMAGQKQQEQQVLGPQRFPRLVRPPK